MTGFARVYPRVQNRGVFSTAEPKALRKTYRLPPEATGRLRRPQAARGRSADTRHHRNPPGSGPWAPASGLPLPGSLSKASEEES